MSGLRPDGSFYHPDGASFGRTEVENRRFELNWRRIACDEGILTTALILATNANYSSIRFPDSPAGDFPHHSMTLGDIQRAYRRIQGMQAGRRKDDDPGWTPSTSAIESHLEHLKLAGLVRKAEPGEGENTDSKTRYHYVTVEGRDQTISLALAMFSLAKKRGAGLETIFQQSWHANQTNQRALRAILQAHQAGIQEITTSDILKQDEQTRGLQNPLEEGRVRRVLRHFDKIGLITYHLTPGHSPRDAAVPITLPHGVDAIAEIIQAIDTRKATVDDLRRWQQDFTPGVSFTFDTQRLSQNALPEIIAATLLNKVDMRTLRDNGVIHPIAEEHLSDLQAAVTKNSTDEMTAVIQRKLDAAPGSHRIEEETLTSSVFATVLQLPRSTGILKIHLLLSMLHPELENRTFDRTREILRILRDEGLMRYDEKRKEWDITPATREKIWGINARIRNLYEQGITDPTVIQQQLASERILPPQFLAEVIVSYTRLHEQKVSSVRKRLREEWVSSIIQHTRDRFGEFMRKTIADASFDARTAGELELHFVDENARVRELFFWLRELREDVDTNKAMISSLEDVISSLYMVYAERVANQGNSGGYDVVGDSPFKLLTAIRSYNPDAGPTFGAWLTQILKNRNTDSFRRQTAASLDELSETTSFEATSTDFAEAEAQSAREGLKSVLSTLRDEGIITDPELDVLILRFDLNETGIEMYYEDIAAAISPKYEGKYNNKGAIKRFEDAALKKIIAQMQNDPSLRSLLLEFF